MELFLALLGVLAPAGVIFYMGKSGFKWGDNIDEGDNDGK